MFAMVWLGGLRDVSVGGASESGGQKQCLVNVAKRGRETGYCTRVTPSYFISLKPTAVLPGDK